MRRPGHALMHVQAKQKKDNGFFHSPFALCVFQMGVSKNRGKTPKWTVKIREHPIKMDDLGVPRLPLFLVQHPNSSKQNPGFHDSSAAARYFLVNYLDFIIGYNEREEPPPAVNSDISIYTVIGDGKLINPIP